MKSASRTLVKSPPELWELIDQPDRMQGLMCALVGRATEVKVNERRPESILRWEASDDGADAWIEVELAEKGWGTNVKLKAENGDRGHPARGLARRRARGARHPAEAALRGDGRTHRAESAARGAIARSEAARGRDAGAGAPRARDARAEATPPTPPKQGKLRRFFGF